MTEPLRISLNESMFIRTDSNTIQVFDKVIMENKKTDTKKTSTRSNITMFKINNTSPNNIFICENQNNKGMEKLTPNMMQEVNQAIKNKGAHDFVAHFHRLRITKSEFETLNDICWLNDSVINFYMNLLIDRGRKEQFPSVHAFNTFFYHTKLKPKGYESVKRWTNNIDIFSHDLVVVPIFYGVHWTLVIIDFNKKAMIYYDSLMVENDKKCHDTLKDLKNYLQNEHSFKKGQTFNFQGWKFKSANGIPQQTNGSDCGTFLCVYANFICANIKLNFDQQDMPYFRNRIKYEIITKKLL